MNMQSLVPELIKATLCICMTVFATSTAAAGKPTQGMTASAHIVSCDPSVDVTGYAVLKERRSEEGVKLVDIFIRAYGLSPGKHAVHIHETALCDPCGSAGGHFDPGPSGESSPDGNHPFHSGDLVNIKINHRGKGTLRTTTSRITLSPGPLSLFDDDGSAFIIHVDEDTYCPNGAVPGCAGGARAACGIIVPN